MAEPFQISIPEDVLVDLRARLANTRWPEKEPVEDWSQGVPLSYLQEICRYWAEDYDWRAREGALNRFEQFTTPVNGVDIHFIHATSPEPDALPLVITHGWPGSVVEFDKVIDGLSDPRSHGGDPSQAFHVICPTLPGFGFSGKPRTTGWGVGEIASAWVELVRGLGYDRFGAQGGDWGAAVTTAIGSIEGSGCIGIHLNMPLGRPAPDDTPENDAEKQAMLALAQYQEWDSGYSKQQSTRPQTLGYGLTDSPAGQAAWILEKYWAWTDCDGHPENALTKDEMLDNIMMYWLNAAATSSARLYWESFGKYRPNPVSVPTGVAAFPKEILPSSRRWCAPLYPNLTHWTDMDRGGHFAAFEQPELFIEDVRRFFATVRGPAPAAGRWRDRGVSPADPIEPHRLEFRSLKLLLTGAGGFFGRNLQNLIGGQSSDGSQTEVHITSRRAVAPRPGVVANHRIDLMDSAAVARLIEEVRPTHLCHLAWVGPEHQDRYRTEENHRWADASEALFSAFRDAGGERLVHLGSCIEYGNRATGVRVETQPLDPDTAYGEAKARLSDVVATLVDAGLSAAIARPFFCYGPYEQPDRLVPSLILGLNEGNTIDLTEGRQLRDYLDVRDIAAALLTLLRTPGATGPFNIGAGEGVQVRTIATKLGELAGHPELLNFGARPEGADSAAEIVADISRITAVTDWKPTITLDEGLEHATGWWLERRGSSSIS